jgi:septal ring factor EnvC (AmiA/AmiB activator)
LAARGENYKTVDIRRAKLLFAVVTALAGVIGGILAALGVMEIVRAVMLIAVCFVASYGAYTEWRQDVLDLQADHPNELQQRIDELRRRLDRARKYLGGVTDILQEVEAEIDARETALAGLDERLKRGEDLATVSEEATAALRAVLAENAERTERRIGRLAWWQGAVYALFGAAVALAINAYAEPLAHLFK